MPPTSHPILLRLPSSGGARPIRWIRSAGGKPVEVARESFPDDLDQTPEFDPTEPEPVPDGRQKHLPRRIPEQMREQLPECLAGVHREKFLPSSVDGAEGSCGAVFPSLHFHRPEAISPGPSSMSEAHPKGIVAFLQEAKRRKVYISGVAYLGVAVVVIELTGAVSEALLFPDWTPRLVTFLLALGFPVVLILSWVFDITGKGVVRTDGRGEAGGEASTRRDSDPSALSTGAGTPPVAPGQPKGRGNRAPLPALRRRWDRQQEAKADGVEASDSGDGQAQENESAAPDPERVRRATVAHLRHELRTPINGIIGYAEILLEDMDEEAYAGDLQRIETGGKKLLNLIDEVLGDGAGKNLQEDLEQYAEEIRVGLRTPVTSVVGYAEMLLETAQEEGRYDLVDDLERIHTSAHRLLELSGDIVGLATAGEMAPGMETSEASELTRTVLSKIHSGNGSGREDGEGQLLVVDDNANNRDLLSRQLARQGYIVHTASDGQEALKLLESKTVDLILLDVIMPNLDGVETLKRLKTSKTLQEIPVLMLSSLDEVDGALRCIELGAEDYLSKPVKPAILEARITANLELFRMRERERIYRERLETDEAFIEVLLQSAFPPAVADRVRAGDTNLANVVPEATVLVGKVRGLGAPSSSGELAQRLQGLSEICRTVEKLSREQGVDTCIWRADGFVAVAGAPTTLDNHVERAAALGRVFQEAGGELVGADGEPLRMGLGIHTGPVVAAALGGTRLRYEVWGDGVTTAEAVAEAAPDGSLVASPPVYGRLKERFTFQARKVQEIAGVQMRTYLLQ